jgi:Lrp/AsnC family transcriptional regulator, regulator for asnA, asnC and gidA
MESGTYHLPQNGYHLDELDLSIMRALQVDGRKPFSDLSKELGIAVSTVSKRYMNLLENGVLKIIGRIDPNKVGLNAYASIFLKMDAVDSVDKTANAIAQLPEVSFLAQRTGEYQLELNLMCNDNNHLLDFMNKHILPIKSISKYEINMYLKVYKWGQPDISNSETDSA